MLRYDDTNHRYYYNDKVVPSVTQVLKAGGISGAENCPYYTEESAARGTAVHKATELLDRGEYPHIGVLHRPYVDGYACFLEKTGFSVEHIEIRVYSAAFGYAGTLDRIGTLNGRSIILDIKTGQVPKWVGCQLWSYFYAAKECGYSPEACFSLQLTAKGTYKLREHKLGNNFSRFLAALEITKNVQYNSGPRDSSSDNVT